MAVFTARLTRIPDACRGAWAKNRDFSDAVYSAEVNPTTRFARFESPALDPDTTYYYCVELDGTLYPHMAGQVRTRPADGTAKSFKFWASGDAGQGQGISGREPNSNHPVFQGILDQRPDFGIHLGDMHYSDIGGQDDRYGKGDYGDFLNSYQMVLNSPGQRRLYRHVPLQYVWDDHDYGPNNSDKTAPGRDNACRSYRDVVPHPGLEEASDTGAIYHYFDYGRCRFIISDYRSEREPDNSTTFGTAQKNWLKGLFQNSPGKMIFWVCSKPWHSTTGDGWNTSEREELANFIRDQGLIGRILYITADHHEMGIDDGASHDYADGGGCPLPLAQCAPLSASPGSGNPDNFNQGLTGNRKGQFGLFEVEDNGGDTIAVTIRAMRTLSDDTSEVEEAFRWTLNADVSGS